jgi:hypothetical protein
MGSYVYRHRDLDPGPRNPDGTRRSMREREISICESLKRQGRVNSNGHIKTGKKSKRVLEVLAHRAAEKAKAAAELAGKP